MSSRDIVFSAAGAGGDVNYIDDVFSTFLYTGNGSTLAINNGIDLAGKGGLVWCKGRDAAFFHSLVDSTRGISKWLGSNSGSGQDTFTDAITSFNNNGFTLGADTQGGYVNASTYNFASWTFREQPKFFDVITWSGNSTNRTISHNLGSVPGMIIVKRLDSGLAWQVYHRSLANTEYLVLNTTAAKATGATRWNSTTPTSTEFSLGTDATVNESGGTYIAYIFAHNAGGFGTAGTDNVISCGYAAAGTTVNLGYEPQWVLTKNPNGVGNWRLFDTMRGLLVDGTSRQLIPNTSDAEGNSGGFVELTSTGFYNGADAIYMAIRRPMKPPTSGTEVFNTDTFRSTTANPNFKFGFVTDMAFNRIKNDVQDWGLGSRLTGTDLLQTASTAAAITSSSYVWDYMNGRGNSTSSANSQNFGWGFKRASGFFDVVCYTGTGANRTVAHNLGVAPELIIVKARNETTGWFTYSKGVNGGITPEQYFLTLNGRSAAGTSSEVWNNTAPASSVFSLGTNSSVNGSGFNYVAYLFASVAGVSKVGSYTGNGSSQTINCGFTAGARFVLIKRTDSTGDWFVWDTARGMVAGTDPRLALNSTAAETNANWVYTTTGGFQIVTTDATVNASGGSYIYLAIA